MTRKQEAEIVKRAYLSSDMDMEELIHILETYSEIQTDTVKDSIAMMESQEETNYELVCLNQINDFKDDLIKIQEGGGK